MTFALGALRSPQELKVTAPLKARPVSKQQAKPGMGLQCAAFKQGLRWCNLCGKCAYVRKGVCSNPSCTLFKAC
jgi:hypothetical protein